MPDATSASSSGDSRVTQKDLQVAGDNAGRDIIRHSVTIATTPTLDSHPSCAYIARLSAKYRYEKENNIEFRKTVDRLEHYQNQADTGLVMTLEEKLEKGGRTNFVQFALRTKEMFAKKLAKNSLYESAQEIHAFLLAEVYVRYHEFVYPDICSGQPIDVINARIRTQIIEPILAILGENALGHYADEINGMLYFLTGNCHIKWTK